MLLSNCLILGNVKAKRGGPLNVGTSNILVLWLFSASDMLLSNCLPENGKAKRGPFNRAGALYAVLFNVIVESKQLYFCYHGRLFWSEWLLDCNGKKGI